MCEERKCSMVDRLRSALNEWRESDPAKLSDEDKARVLLNGWLKKSSIDRLRESLSDWREFVNNDEGSDDE